jgi:hypothetical protein
MKKPETDDEPYLWDRSGEPDPDIVRLEKVLGQLRQHRTLPALPARPRRVLRVSTWTMGVLSAAAAVLLIAAAGWFVLERARSGWSVQTIAGTPVIDGIRAGDTRAAANVRLGIGEWLVTDGLSRARIAVGQIGRVDVGPNTRLQLMEARGREHRMALTRGTIHARIWAPPKFFYVNTPSATAIDLGCEYTLQVDDSGAGLVRVTLGWVGFEGGGREAFIPAGAVGATRPGVGPGTPYYEDAPSGYGDALAILDFGRPDDPGRAAAFELVLSSARRRDALTLWHLLSRVPPAERPRVFDRLAALAPPPRADTRAAELAGARRALDQWWDSLGIDNTTWWRLWKKKF